jgi:neutral ceramidase
VSTSIALGAASADITPLPGLHISGGLAPVVSLGTRDPLLARALVLDDGTTRVALVALDIIGIERAEALRARELIAARTGIPSANVLIACSHTHQGPTTIHYSACDWPTDYMEALPRRIAEVVARAAAALEPVEWGLAVAEERTVGHYRRVRLKDGRVRNTWQLPADAEIAGPLGEIDPELSILAFRSGQGPRAAVLNFACHATCSGDGRWSSNYPGALSARVGADLGIPPEQVLYTAGAAANTNPVVLDPFEFGATLAKVVPPVWPSIAWQTGGRLVIREKSISLPHRQVDRFPFTHVEDVWNNRGSRLGFALSLKYYADEYARLTRRGPVPEETVLQVLALDDVAMVAIPGELFVELGREIKRRSPFRSTQIVTLANDWVGYIPHRAAFEEGGYETIYASQSRLAPEAGDLVVESAVDLLREAAEHQATGASSN